MDRPIKKAVGVIFMGLVVVLMILPFVTTFNELLTRIVENSWLYLPIKNYVVPYEIAVVRTILGLVGIPTATGTVAVIKNGQNLGTYISWNCIGWQSVVILILSLKTGLAGSFTRWSKLQVVVFGILGTFFINLARITLVLVLLYYWGKIPSAIFHDYAGVFLSIVWLFFFWWFSYKYVLE